MAAYIHPDDLRALRALSGDLEGKAYLETEARIVTAQGRYRWNRLRLSFLRAEDGALGTVVGVLMDIDQEKRNASALQKKAEEDPLTGLLNKNFTHARIAAALENQPEGSLSALLILDMDNFKQVNDRCGHPYGDTVLTWAAERLRHFFRSGDIIGRIGGDEFMIFLKNVPDTALVEKRCQGLLQAMSSLLDGREGAVKLSCSLGVALAPEHGGPSRSSSSGRTTPSTRPRPWARTAMSSIPGRPPGCSGSPPPPGPGSNPTGGGRRPGRSCCASPCAASAAARTRSGRCCRCWRPWAGRPM